MIIKSIEPHLLSCPLPEPVIFRFHGGQRTIYKRDAMVIRIETQDGAVGYAPGPASEDAVRKIEKEIAPQPSWSKTSRPLAFCGGYA
jgi:L-alanine-DL-glutamate epimerase-like enolase superfamily enzyme